MLDPDIAIIRQMEDPKYDRSGARVDYIRVEFYVGKHGPFVERIEKTDDWHVQRDAIVNATAAKVRV